MTVALIKLAPLALVSVHGGDPGRLDLPGDIQVHGAALGWEGEGYKIVPVIDTDPALDPLTQVKEGPVVTVSALDVKRVWTVRAKNAGELDAQKNEQVAALNGGSANLLILRNIENRLRLVENAALGTSKTPISMVQLIAAIKALLP